jgi:hypothetical protein
MFTGKLTQEMVQDVLRRAAGHAHPHRRCPNGVTSEGRPPLFRKVGHSMCHGTK